MVLLALVIVGSTAPLVSDGSAKAPTSFYVESSGHILQEPFLTYWIDNNGRGTLGDPVTDIVRWGTREAQYFEYGLLVQRGDGSLKRLKVARELLELRHIPDSVTSTSRRIGSEPRTGGYAPVVVPLSQQTLPIEPAYAVADLVQTFYFSHGAKEYFGKPLTNALRAGDRTIQWFEYGRVEIANGQAQLASVGTELALSLDLDTSATLRGDVPLFDPNRYRQFTGDGTIANAEGEFIPTRISIPKLRVNTLVESIGVTNGVMDTPKNVWNVGWYPSTASPGEWTNVVMSGHRDWWSVGPVVFWNLHLLVPGDKIYVSGPDGSGATYVVITGWLVDADIHARELISDTGFEALTLITCGGIWNGKEYLSRYVIRAQRI